MLTAHTAGVVGFTKTDNASDNASIYRNCGENYANQAQAILIQQSEKVMGQKLFCLSDYYDRQA